MPKLCPKCGADHSKIAYCGSRLKEIYCWHCEKPIQSGEFCSAYCADAAEFDRKLP